MRVLQAPHLKGLNLCSASALTMPTPPLLRWMARHGRGLSFRQPLKGRWVGSERVGGRGRWAGMDGVCDCVETQDTLKGLDGGAGGGAVVRAHKAVLSAAVLPHQFAPIFSSYVAPC